MHRPYLKVVVDNMSLGGEIADKSLTLDHCPFDMLIPVIYKTRDLWEFR